MDARTPNALLVDDDSDSSQSTKERLEGDGYSVVHARDAAEGLTRAKKSAPNIIFAHLVTGGQSSMAFIQALRSDDSCRHIPVVVLPGTSKVAAKHTRLRSVSRDRW